MQVNHNQLNVYQTPIPIEADRHLEQINIEAKEMGKAVQDVEKQLKAFAYSKPIQLFFKVISYLPKIGALFVAYRVRCLEKILHQYEANIASKIIDPKAVIIPKADEIKDIESLFDNAIKQIRQLKGEKLLQKGNENPFEANVMVTNYSDSSLYNNKHVSQSHEEEISLISPDLLDQLQGNEQLFGVATPLRNDDLNSLENINIGEGSISNRINAIWQKHIPSLDLRISSLDEEINELQNSLYTEYFPQLEKLLQAIEPKESDPLTPAGSLPLPEIEYYNNFQDTRKWDPKVKQVNKFDFELSDKFPEILPDNEILKRETKDGERLVFTKYKHTLQYDLKKQKFILYKTKYEVTYKAQIFQVYNYDTGSTINQRGPYRLESKKYVSESKTPLSRIGEEIEKGRKMEWTDLYTLPIVEKLLLQQKTDKGGVIQQMPIENLQRLSDLYKARARLSSPT